MTTLNTLSIPAHLIRAAQSCQAKKDVRFYLNGILLAKNGDIVGTDGHTLCKTFSKELADYGLTQDLIIDIAGMVPKSAKTCEFTFNTQIQDVEGVDTAVIVDGTVECFAKSGSKLFKLGAVDGRYPDYSRVIPSAVKNDVPTSPVNLSRIQPAYLARAAVFTENARGEGVDMHIPNDNSAITITPTIGEWPQGTVMVIMAMRIEDGRPMNGGYASYIKNDSMAA